MSETRFTQMQFADALKEKYTKIYINNPSKKLILGWTKGASIIWLLLFGPIYLWTKGLILWALVTLIPYWVLIVECNKALKGEDLPIYLGFFAFYVLLLIGTKGRIIKRGRKLSEGADPIFDGENLIFGTSDQSQRIMAGGLGEFMDSQRKKTIAEQEQSKIDEFTRKRNAFIQSAAKDYEKSITQRSVRFTFVDGAGFGIHPDFVKFSWSVSDKELLKIKNQSEHIAEPADIAKLEVKGLKSAFNSKKTLLEDDQSISISLGKESVGVPDLIRISFEERQQVTRAREEKTEYITKGVTVSNVATVGNSPISVARSKTVAETKIKNERGDIILLVDVELRDGRKISARNKFGYEGEEVERAYYEFVEFINYLKGRVSGSQPKH